MKILKLLSVITVFVVILSAFTGCANKNNKDNDSTILYDTKCPVKAKQNDIDLIKPEWSLKKINEPVVEPVQIKNITINNSKSIDMVSTVIKNYDNDELRALISKENIFQKCFILADYSSENAYSGAHYKDAPNYLYASVNTETGVIGRSKSNAEQTGYDDLKIILKNQYLAYYSTPNVVMYEISDVSDENVKETQKTAYNILSNIIGNNNAEYLVYGGENVNLNSTLKASDGSEYNFIREIVEEKGIKLQLTITANVKSRSGIYAYYIPEEFTSISQNLKYKISDIVEKNNFYDFDFKSDAFLKDYRSNCGIIYGDEQRIAIYPDKININIIKGDDDFIQNSVYLKCTSTLSSDISIDYNVVENDGKVNKCDLKISGISGNISDTTNKSDSYKQLSTESKKCINYFFPSVDLTSIIIGETDDNKSINAEYDKTLLGIDGKLACSVKAKQSAIDTWVGSYEISFKSN